MKPAERGYMSNGVFIPVRGDGEKPRDAAALAKEVAQLKRQVAALSKTVEELTARLPPPAGFFS